MSGLDVMNSAGRQSVPEELRLYHFVVNNHTQLKYVRPVRYANENVHVELTIAVIGLDDLDEKRQVMMSHVWVRQRWRNPFLSWDPDSYNQLRSILIPKEALWHPDILAENSLSSNSPRASHSKLLVNNDGMIVWTRQDRLETFCDVDMTYFPLDRHNCSVIYRSANYGSNQLTISYSGYQNPDLGYGNMIRNSKWIVLDHSVIHHSVAGGFDSKEHYDDVTVYVTLSRRHSYVIQIYVAPLVMFVLLTSSVFMLPAQSAHKFVLGTGLLISEILLLTSLNDIIPTSHHAPPRLGIYYLCAMVLVSVSLAISALVANLWNRSKRRSYGVPSCVRVVLLKVLGRLLCLHYEDFLCVDADPGHVFDQYTTSLDTVSQGSANHPLDDAKVIREYNSHVVHRAEWRQLAAVIDRAFFLLFWAASIVFIVTMVMKL